MNSTKETETAQKTDHNQSYQKEKNKVLKRKCIIPKEEISKF